MNADVDGLREVAGRYEKQIGVLFAKMVQLYQGGIGRSMNIDRIGFQAQLASVHGRASRPHRAIRRSDRSERVQQWSRPNNSVTAFWDFPIAELEQGVWFNF